MRCEELREWLSADLDGEARDAERATAREHLAACAACRHARAAAERLRGELSAAAREWVAEDRDEAVLVVLRDEGLCGAEIGIEAQRHRAYLRSLRSLCLRGLSPLSTNSSLRSAALVTTLSFLVTWGSLRWAETGRAGAACVPASLPATAAARPPDGAMLDEWMAGPPTLAALSRLQRRPEPPPAVPVLLRRGAVLQERPRVG